jgi:hypothetical protein
MSEFNFHVSAVCYISSMGRIILTGLTKNGKHEFELRYIFIDEIEHCLVVCKCGFESEIIHFNNYAGTKELSRIWDHHVKNKKSRVD